MNETIAVIGGSAILGFFAYAVAAILVGIFREESHYEARPVQVVPPCGPACGDYNFTDWSAEQVQEYNETRQIPVSTRGVLPEPSHAELPDSSQARALPAPNVIEGRLRDIPAKALSEGDRNIPIHVPERERVRVRR